MVGHAVERRAVARKCQRTHRIAAIIAASKCIQSRQDPVGAQGERRAGIAGTTARSYPEKCRAIACAGQRAVRISPIIAASKSVQSRESPVGAQGERRAVIKVGTIVLCHPVEQRAITRERKRSPGKAPIVAASKCVESG